MITATLKFADNGLYCGFKVKGHSGSAPKGHDIICAAVSAIVQTALIGLDEVALIKDSYVISDGLVECNLPDASDNDSLNKAQIIINVMHLGLISIAEQYHDFVRINEE